MSEYIDPYDDDYREQFAKLFRSAQLQKKLRYRPPVRRLKKELRWKDVENMLQRMSDDQKESQ